MFCVGMVPAAWLGPARTVLYRLCDEVPAGGGNICKPWLGITRSVLSIEVERKPLGPTIIA
jgi:hypothetical protein